MTCAVDRELYLSFNDVVAACLHQTSSVALAAEAHGPSWESAVLPMPGEFHAEDATPLSGCEQLEVLDLEGNAIVDEEDIRPLASNRRLERELHEVARAKSSTFRSFGQLLAPATLGERRFFTSWVRSTSRLRSKNKFEGRAWNPFRNS